MLKLQALFCRLCQYPGCACEVASLDERRVRWREEWHFGRGNARRQLSCRWDTESADKSFTRPSSTPRLMGKVQAVVKAEG